MSARRKLFEKVVEIGIPPLFLVVVEYRASSLRHLSCVEYRVLFPHLVLREGSKDEHQKDEESMVDYLRVGENMVFRLRGHSGEKKANMAFFRTMEGNCPLCVVRMVSGYEK
jgi:hypothetical protein